MRVLLNGGEEVLIVNGRIRSDASERVRKVIRYLEDFAPYGPEWGLSKDIYYGNELLRAFGGVMTDMGNPDPHIEGRIY